MNVLGLGELRARPDARLLPAVVGEAHPALAAREEIVVGVLAGEGIGPELTAAAVRVLRAAAEAHGRPLHVSNGPPVERAQLSPAVSEFVTSTFARGGAVLSGAVSGRFVYALRRELDLFCKLVPVRPWLALESSSPFRAGHLRDVDIVLVRENASGLYQGRGRREGYDGDARVKHTFGYTQGEIERIVRVAATIAATRRGRLAVVVKDGGLPELSTLWREGAVEACAGPGIQPLFVDIDLCAYQLARAPDTLDVIVAPNMFGDVLADVSALLLGARGVSYSGNFSSSGGAVYQTNHGAAFDLVGADVANPVGQFSALAMLLRESAGEPALADTILTAVDAVWQAGWRTRDVAGPRDRVVGTRDLTDRIVEAIGTSTPSPSSTHAK